MRWLVLGGTGALGQVMLAAIRARGDEALSAARSGAELNFDLGDLDALDKALARARPEGVINCAGLVDLAACERDPGGAYCTNARPLAMLAAWSAAAGKPLAHVSTDQFFGDAAPMTRHSEGAPLVLRNEYARSKHAGENFALTSPHALVVRTNLSAAFSGRGKASLAAWAFESFAARAPMTLFTDYFCSTIDAGALSNAILDLVAASATGLLNVASRDVASKADFIQALAKAAGVRLDWASFGSAAELYPPRAHSTGLDVRRAEALLGRAMPGLHEVAANLVKQRNAP